MLPSSHPVGVVAVASHIRAGAGVAASRNSLALSSVQPDRSRQFGATSSLVAVVCCGRLHMRRRCRRVARKAGDDDNLLIQAGLKNLLGVKENRMAQKLEEACVVSKDLQRCLSDVEVQHKVAVEEVSELSKQLAAVEADKRDLEAKGEEVSAKAEEEISKLQKQLAAAGEDEQVLKDRVKKMFFQAGDDVAELQRQLTAAIADKQDLKAQMEKLSAKAEEEVSKHQKQLATAEADKQDLKAQVEELSAKTEEMRKKNSTLEANTSEAIAAAKEEASTAHLEAANQVKEAKAESEAAKAELKAMQQAVKEAKVEAESMRSELSAAKSALSGKAQSAAKPKEAAKK